MSRATLFFVPFILVLCGCQQAAWKAGANADDLKRDELACQKQALDDAAIAQCLRDKGWHITNYDLAPAEEDVVADDEIKTSSPLTESVRKQQGANETAVNSAAPLATEKPVAKADPFQRVSVQTWWKAGAQAADFQKDADACLTRLGEQHTPDYSKRLFTRGMVNCLRESGWYAGRDPVYTPLR